MKTAADSCESILMLLLEATKFQRACHFSERTFPCKGFERKLYTTSNCLEILGKFIQKTSEVRCTLRRIMLLVVLITPALVPQPWLWKTCHGGNKLRDPLSSPAPGLPLPLFLLLSASLSRILSLVLMWHLPLALFLKPNVSSTKQPLRGACWKKVAIS